MFGCINSISAWRTRAEPKELKWKFRKWYFPVLHSISMTSCEGQYLVWDVKTVLWFNEKQADVNRCRIVCIIHFLFWPDNYLGWLEENIPQNKRWGLIFTILCQQSERKIENFNRQLHLRLIFKNILSLHSVQTCVLLWSCSRKKLKGHKFFQCHFNLAFWWMFLQYGDAGLS